MMCLTCRNQGMVGGCPTCGMEIMLDKPVLNVTEDNLEEVAIPQFYQRNTWSKKTFLESHMGDRAGALVERYAESLDRIHNIFCSGKIPDKSCIVVAQHGMGKMVWAYSCIQTAMSHGYSVVPILDNTQYKRLNIISSDRISSKILKQKYTIEDYNTADVMFLTIDPDNFQGSYRTVESLLSKRSRNGKSTFILSRYSVEQMSLLDYSATFRKTIEANVSQDRNKYVVIIGG